MNDEIGVYTFFPWLRQGIANKIKSQDLDSSVKVRASIKVGLTLKGKGLKGEKLETIHKDVALYGPGDIVGIESKAVIKTEPNKWVTNFEPNYLPSIEFYDEDFPWRYTPASPNSTLGRLRPWIMLIVLKEDEFKEGKDISDKPLPYIEIANACDVLPPADQLWAWAHVHINEDVVKLADNIESNDLGSLLPRFSNILDTDPDLAYSRILCPRKLAANTPYHAFLIPVFESGRLAGLNLDIPPDTAATKSAWDNSQKEFPYYYRWYFRTGTVGDFEYLVRLLEPKAVDGRVGRRDMDVQDPGANINGITDEELGGVLKLGGALKIPFKAMSKEDKAQILKYENWDRLEELNKLSAKKTDILLSKDTPERLGQGKPHKFQTELASFVNLADDYSYKEAGDANRNSEISQAIKNSTQEDGSDDPLITPPLYGRWHAKIQRLLENREGRPVSPSDNWIHELNLDPRWRTAAGFGTSIIQKKQEEYMDAAWGQVGEILEANRRIRLAQMAKATSSVFYNRHIAGIVEKSTEKAFAFTAPVQKRIIAQNATVYHKVNTSRVPYAVISSPMRRITRPNSRLMRTLPIEGDAYSNLIDRINKEKIYPAPPKEAPETIPTLDDLSKALRPEKVPGFLINLLSKCPWLKYLPLIIAVLLIITVFLLDISIISRSAGGVLAAIFVYLFTILKKLTSQIKDAESVLEKNQRPEAVDKLIKSPDFRISDIGEEFVFSQGTADNQEAVRFKTALRDTYGFVQASGQAAIPPELNELDIRLMLDEIIKGINPELTIPRLVLNNIRIPERIYKLIGEDFKEAMAYPEFDLPMYKPLVEISNDLFLPNMDYISQNSISLLETNQRFIEAYMVGLNHEFARELLWREYPTDQRGSYFRQFWDVSSHLDLSEDDPEKQRERLKDIPALHQWSKYSKLGGHDYREEQGDKKEEVVLVIRGELLKKYPTAVVYAHKAEWQRKEKGSIDNAAERILVALTDEEAENPPQNKIKLPLFEAKAEPDIYFIGFDLSVEEAKGDPGENPSDDAGWFFVIKERPGELRFGLDIDKSEDINVWNDLSWEDITQGAEDGVFINIDSDTPTITLNDPHGNNELENKFDQYDEDKHITWNKDMNAAEIAYILYQAPVSIAVHANELLTKN